MKRLSSRATRRIRSLTLTNLGYSLTYSGPGYQIGGTDQPSKNNTQIDCFSFREESTAGVGPVEV